jgi:sulfatase maturation enzyme AslB (radical SAM superfamily)
MVTGNIRECPLEEVWNSENIQKLRQSIIDGSYRYCRKDCYVIPRSPTMEELPEPYRTYIRDGRTELPLSAIERLSDSHDYRCNLACPSCRPEIHKLTDEERKAYPVIEREIDKILLHVKEYDTSLQGDPFASPYTRKKLQTMDPKDYPHLCSVILETNGQLLTPDMWTSMHKLHPLIQWLFISLDGASKASYEANRFPGKWERIVENLEYLAKVRRQMAHPFYFILKFIIQQNNFRELVTFCNLCAQWGAHAFLQMLENWGTYEDAGFRERAVQLPGHPDHDELQAILRDPALHQPHVDWGTLSSISIHKENYSPAVCDHIH